MVRITMTLIAVAALASPARADRFELGIASGARYTESDSVDPLTADDSQSTAGVWLGVRLPDVQMFGFDVYADVEYEHASLSGTTFQRIDSDMGVDTLRVGGRARHELGYRTSVFARAAMGWITADLALSDSLSSSGRPTEDRAHGLSTTLGAGAQFDIARRPSFAFGLRADFDYTETSRLSFDAAPRMEENALAIPLAAANLGEVDLSGWSLRFGLFARF